jgi:hypothetical protein
MAATFLTLGCNFVVGLVNGGEGRAPGIYALLLWAIVEYPAAMVSKLLGLSWQIDSPYSVYDARLLFMVLVNVLLFVGLGGTVGFLYLRFAKHGIDLVDLRR